MSDASGPTPQPLPPDWLPDPQPPAGSPEWDATVERIMAAAEPELRGLGSSRVPAWSIMGLWRKPAAVLAVAATVLLFLMERPASSPESPQRSLPLSLIAAGGDPVSLWEAFGIEADTVLALIAMQRQEDVAGQEESSRSAGPEERR